MFFNLIFSSFRRGTSSYYTHDIVLMNSPTPLNSPLFSRLIGQRGKNIRKIMEKFGVDIKFSGGETGNTVSVEGNEANVEECKEHLLELAEEMVRFPLLLPFKLLMS